MSKFYGIGVGPGDLELVTLKAIKTIEKLDVLFVPIGKKDGESVAYKIVADFVKPQTTIESRHFPMMGMDEKTMSAIAEIANEIKAFVHQGKNVGFVTIGDSTLYSTYGYLLKELKDYIEVETIPGISSFSAIASGYNWILTEGEVPLLVYPCTADLNELEQILLKYESVVLMKVYKHYNDIVKLIKKLDLQDSALAVTDFGKDTEKRLPMNEDVQAGYFTTILINRRQ